MTDRIKNLYSKKKLGHNCGDAEKSITVHKERTISAALATFGALFLFLFT